MIVTLKSEEEIIGFKKAGKIAALILKILLNNLKQNTIPKDIDKLAKELCKEYNVIPTFLGYQNFPAAICFSKNNVMVHGIPDTIPLKENDIVSIDFGATLNGFIGDTADTIKIGESSFLEECCSEALYAAIDQAIVGNKLSDIGKTINKIADKNNYVIPTGYGGHGIDYNFLHSPPFVSNTYDIDDDVSLVNGMVLAIEPMFIDAQSNRTVVGNDGWSVYAKGNTAHCEHTILINDDKPTILTRSCDG